MRSPSPRVTYSYSDPAVRTSLASLDTIQPIAKTPIPAISTDSGDAMPPPLPVTLATPTTSGITKAEVNTGPMNPTDCAITSGNDNTFAPRRPVSGWGFSRSSTISFLSSLRVDDRGSVAWPHHLPVGSGSGGRVRDGRRSDAIARGHGWPADPGSGPPPG